MWTSEAGIELSMALLRVSRTCSQIFWYQYR
jgi:hypothetical protein